MWFVRLDFFSLKLSHSVSLCLSSAFSLSLSLCISTSSSSLSLSSSGAESFLCSYCLCVCVSEFWIYFLCFRKFQCENSVNDIQCFTRNGVHRYLTVVITLNFHTDTQTTTFHPMHIVQNHKIRDHQICSVQQAFNFVRKICTQTHPILWCWIFHILTFPCKREKAFVNSKRKPTSLCRKRILDGLETEFGRDREGDTSQIIYPISVTKQIVVVKCRVKCNLWIFNRFSKQIKYNIISLLCCT